MHPLWASQHINTISLDKYLGFQFKFLNSKKQKILVSNIKILIVNSTIFCKSKGKFCIMFISTSKL
jgi:hypothetical protein